MFRAFFVDDEPLVLDEFASNPLFSECGYQVVGKSINPVKAINEIGKQLPDVVFTDLKMPELSGVAMMEKLRNRGVTCEFVIISAFPEFEESRSFFLLDGFDYLLKPVSDRDLQSLLGKLSGRLACKKNLSHSNNASGTSSSELNMIIDYVNENLSVKHSLESLSREFHTNPSYICQLFAAHLGTTFTAYLTKLRMEEAAKLLTDTQREINEVAALCGYRDYFYFCRVFRKHHLCTPTAFRESLLRESLQ